ncbi:MAG: ABC transporter substrate-binding protein [Rhodocyclaceae bacterium]|nr:ABC transporter substrate-binding protein [Rhodocyclaceae bacterium]
MTTSRHDRTLSPNPSPVKGEGSGVSRSASFTLMLLLALLALVGCGEPPAPPLRVGTNPWVGYDPLVLARERRLLDPGQVQVVELVSNTETQRTLRNGLLDGAAMTLDEALRLADEGVALKIVAVLDISHGADAVLAGPGITTPAQLKGRRIAVEQTALGALVLDRLLQAGGLRPDEVSLIQAEAGLHEGMLASGRVDAVITFEPMKSRIVALGNRVIFDSRQMPGEIVDVLAVRADAWSTRRPQVLELLAGWERGRRALLADPSAAAALLAPGADLPPAQYLATLEGLKFQTLADSARWLGGQPAPLAQHAAMLARTLQHLGLIRHPPDWSVLLDGRSAAAAQSHLVNSP